MSEFSHVPRFRQALKPTNHVKPAVLSTHDTLISSVTDSHHDCPNFHLLLGLLPNNKYSDIHVEFLKRDY